MLTYGHRLKSDPQRLAYALYAASRHWSFEIQFDKGLAGAPDDALAASRDTATNPAVLTAFGLALIGSFGPPPSIPASRAMRRTLLRRAARPR